MSYENYVTNIFKRNVICCSIDKKHNEVLLKVKGDSLSHVEMTNTINYFREFYPMEIIFEFSNN